jgi:hypothetical protein
MVALAGMYATAALVQAAVVRGSAGLQKSADMHAIGRGFIIRGCVVTVRGLHVQILSRLTAVISRRQCPLRPRIRQYRGIPLLAAAAAVGSLHSARGVAQLLRRRHHPRRRPTRNPHRKTC